MMPFSTRIDSIALARAASSSSLCLARPSTGWMCSVDIDMSGPFGWVREEGLGRGEVGLPQVHVHDGVGAAGVPPPEFLGGELHGVEVLGVLAQPDGVGVGVDVGSVGCGDL